MCVGGKWSVCVCVCVEGGDSACVRVFLCVFYNTCINKYIEACSCACLPVVCRTDTLCLYRLHTVFRLLIYFMCVYMLFVEQIPHD